MSYSNARKGIKKVYCAQLFTIIATLFSGGFGLLLVVVEFFFKDDDAVVNLLFGAAIIFTMLLYVAALALSSVIGIVGYAQASRDEPEFKKAMFCALAVGVLTLFGFFFQIPNGMISTILSSAGAIVEMFVMIYVFCGLVRICENFGRHDMTKRAWRVLNLLVSIYIVSAVNALVIRIFELSSHAQSVSVLVGAIDLTLNIIQYILYMKYLRRVLRMIPKD